MAKSSFLAEVNFNFKHILLYILLLLLLNSSKQMLAGPEKLQFQTINLFSVTGRNILSCGLEKFIRLHVFILIHRT